MKSLNTTAKLFRQGDLLGTGAYAHVYRATREEDGHVRAFALKKSRVSLRVNRTLLRHESRVLQLLQGHPAIPKIYAYTHVEHFEYFVMELLGKTLGDMQQVHCKLHVKAVLLIADQMISALEYIHARGIIHRDIKPQNILTKLDAPHTLCIIDFGIARPYKTGEPSVRDPHVEGRAIVGTLDWASLNAHHGVELSRRDDLESLAFTLLFLLRGDLPWRGMARSLTILQSMAQVREKKRAWTGSRLSEGYPAEFGTLLDYARALGFDDMPDYGKLRSMFQQLYRRLGFESERTLDWNSLAEGASASPSPAPQDLNEPPPPPMIVKVGQLVNVQVLSRLTIEGYTSQARDRSYWHDPDLSLDKWRTRPRPAIVLATSVDGSGRRVVRVVPLTRGRLRSETARRGAVQLASTPPSSETEDTDVAVVHPPWPIDDTFCYSFFGFDEFAVDPEQTALIPAHWSISEHDAHRLAEKYDPKTHAPRPPDADGDADGDADRDAKSHARMRSRFAYCVYARFAPLDPGTLAAQATTTTTTAPHGLAERESVDWAGARGWFDELVLINQRRSADAGWAWTGSSRVQNHDNDNEEEEEAEDLSDSYYGYDIADWEAQQERDRSLTLGAVDVARLDGAIENDFQVVSV